MIGDPGAADMFDDRVYKRGALALHALRTAVGDDAFFGLLRSWTAEHRFGSVTTPDFLAFVTRTLPGTDAEALLGPWLHAGALPAP